MKNSKYNYLVIEDDTNVWENIRCRMLAYDDWQALEFSSELTDAVAKITEEKPELIFTDWSIRGGNAYQILESISTVENYTPYIIFFTGYQSENPEIPQKIVNHFPIVKKYIIKPIYENLTNHLAEYIEEARLLALKSGEKKEIWIEDFMQRKFRINPAECMAFLQIPDRPRMKRLIVKDMPSITLKYTWEDCSRLILKWGIDFFVAYHRKSIINKAFVKKLDNRKIILADDTIIEVSREQWKEIERSFTFQYY